LATKQGVAIVCFHACCLQHKQLRKQQPHLVSKRWVIDNNVDDNENDGEGSDYDDSDDDDSSYI
jgi:hypothetical protein